MPGGPERAEVKGSGDALSAGRAAAPDQFQREALGRGRSDDRVARELAERAKPGGSCGHGEAARASARARQFQAMARAVFVAIAAGFLLAGPAAADPIFIKPGDTNTLELPVLNLSASVDGMGDVEAVLVLPAELEGKITVTGVTIKNSAQVPPIEIPISESRTFVVAYTVGQNIPEGSFDAILRLRLTNVLVEGGAASLDTSIHFEVRREIKIFERLSSASRRLLYPEEITQVTDFEFEATGTNLTSLKLEGPSARTVAVGNAVFLAGTVLDLKPEGKYTAVANNSAGNSNSETFRLDIDPPHLGIVDSRASVLVNDGFTNSEMIVVISTDLGAGIKSVTLKNLETNTTLPVKFTSGPDVQETFLPIFGLNAPLPIGRWQAKVVSGTNRESVWNFRIERTAPHLAVYSVDGPTAPVPEGGTANISGVKIKATEEEFGSGIVGLRLELLEVDPADAFQESFSYSDVPAAEMTSSALPEGKFLVTAIDAAGNISAQTIWIDRTAPRLKVQDHLPEGGVRDPPIWQGNSQVRPWWLHNFVAGTPVSGIMFEGLDNQGISHFEIGRNGSASFLDQPVEASTPNINVGTHVLPEGLGYYARVTDKGGLASKLEFAIDSLPPVVDYYLTADLTFGLSVHGSATDGGSGVRMTDVWEGTTQGVGVPAIDAPAGAAQKSIESSLSPANIQTYFVVAQDAAGNLNPFNPIGKDSYGFTDRYIDLLGAFANGEWFEPGQEGTNTPGGGGGLSINGNIGNILTGAVRTNSCGSVEFKVRSNPLITSPGFTSGVATVRIEANGMTPEESISLPLETPKVLGPQAQLKVTYNSNGCSAEASRGYIVFSYVGHSARGFIGPESIPLASGTNISVALGAVSVTLENVMEGPGNRIAAIPRDGIAPIGYRILPGNRILDLITTASHSGEIEVCLSYSPTPGTSLSASAIKLFHEEAGGWIDITAAAVSGTGRICGRTTTLSPFGLFVSTDVLPFDTTPPLTAISIDGTAVDDGSRRLISSAHSKVRLTASDLGVGVEKTYYKIDPTDSLFALGLSSSTRGSFVEYAGPFPLVEGARGVAYGSVDLDGNFENLSSATIVVDGTPPTVTATVEGATVTLSAFDPDSVGASSGLDRIDYLVDVDPSSCEGVDSDTAAPRGTCANTLYAGSFVLAVGTHTVLYLATDRVGNAREVIYSTTVVVPGLPVILAPLNGPIGVPFSVSGSGFGTYGGSNTRIKFGTVVAPVSVWNDASIVGTIPGLSTGAYAVSIERQHASSVTSVSAGLFTVTALEPQSLSASSGPIGIPFTITGAGFGPYAGSNSRVMVGVTTAPVSVWNDTTISGTIPGVPSGETTIQLVRTTNDGGISLSEAAPFTVTTPSVAAISPSSGPIGGVFSLSGESFGPCAGSNSAVLIGGATAPVSVWNDASIIGTIPGTLLPGVHAVLVERRTSDGGLARANTIYFEVTGLGLSSLNPSNGPIGVPFTIRGAGFGAYGGSNTRVKFGDAVAAVSLWNDTQINGTIPSLSTGTWTVVVERQQGTSVSQSNTSSFTLTALEIATLTPSSGSIGAPFTITGTGYGPYAGTNSRVLIGGASASVSLWNDTTISGSIPALPAGPHAVRLERASGAGLQASAEAEILVVDPAIAAMSPSSGPIGTGFTVTGVGFGPYGGANTVLLIGGSTASVSLWNDTTIIGTVPGSLPTGLKPVVVTRFATGGSTTSNAAEFQVTGMSLDAVNPSSGPIGAPFTVTGTQFGTYGGSNTRLRVGGVVAAVSLWNDTTISGTVPNLTPGVVELVVERQQGANTALSNISSFTVVGLSPTGLTPTAGPIGTAFTLTGSGFGPYGGSNTRVLVAGLTASVSLWNDTTIKGTIPTAAAGEQPMWIERQLGAAVQSSDTAYFTITVPSVASLTPSSAPIGAPFTLTGTSFGVYGGANTRVKFNGVVAPVSVWNDTTITGSVPGVLTPGAVELVVERAVGAGLASSSTQAFVVLLPTVSTIAPGYGPAGTVVTLTGSGFGPYGGSLTKVLVGGTTTAVSVWNDSTIRWTVPASLTDGEYPVIVRRSPTGGTADSEPVNFTVGTGYGTSSFGFTQTMSLASTPDSHFEGDLALSSTTGGRIDTPAKAAVEIPPNAMDEDTSITLKRAHSDGLRNSAAEDIQRRAAGEPIEFGPEGARFATPVTIELPYDPALIADETKIAIHYFNPLRRNWEELASVVDRARKVVTAKTDHFSIYQPMGLAPTAASQDEFYFRDAYAFPNPSRGGSIVTFRIQPGLAETIELRVYDLAGRKVHESTDFTFRGAFDDGNGKGVQNTYDHAWSVGGIGSGVYNFVMKASQRGNKPIVKSGKVGVIR